MKTKQRSAALLLALLAITLLGLVGCGNGKIRPNAATHSSMGDTFGATLATPMGVRYDAESHTLRWSAVENAVGYTVSQNGREHTLDATVTELPVLLTASSTVFRVKANGDQGNHLDSEWSEPYTHTVNPEEETLYQRVNFILSEFARKYDYELLQIIGIGDPFCGKDDGVPYVRFDVETIAVTGGKQKNLRYMIRKRNISSIDDAIQTLSVEDVVNGDPDSIVDYDSADFYARSDAYAGKMQELKNEGYTITAVAGCTREGEKVGSKFRYEFVGTYKATRGNEVLYFTSTNRADILEPAANPRLNYEEILRYPHYRKITETAFMLHESGSSLQYMEEWAKEYDPDR